MLSRCQEKPIENVEMWLAVQYWEVYYNEFEGTERSERKHQNKNKRVRFNDVKEVREIQAENQIYVRMEEIDKNPKIKKL